MNDHKIAFIICSNNDVFLNETTVYLNRLIVPEGFEIELLAITEADSMLMGMQEGRESTDAKYKVYMHQDVFILNRYFLADMLTIFGSDEKIGLLGMVGYTKTAENGVMWSEEAEGRLYCQKSIVSADYSTYRYREEDGIIDVLTVDGLLMATAYDVPLRTDLFDGWDFYDFSTSLEYKRAGYRVVVPEQRCPWVLHDDGKYLSLWEYDKNRHIAMKEYAEYLGLEEAYHYGKRITNG